MKQGSRSCDLKVGDKVRLIGIPPGATNDEEFQTRAWFEKCLGKSVVVAGLKTVEGVPYQLVQLDVGQMLGKANYLESIWVEPEYLELQNPD